MSIDLSKIESGNVKLRCGVIVEITSIKRMANMTVFPYAVRFNNDVTPVFYNQEGFYTSHPIHSFDMVEIQ